MDLSVHQYMVVKREISASSTDETRVFQTIDSLFIVLYNPSKCGLRVPNRSADDINKPALQRIQDSTFQTSCPFLDFLARVIIHRRPKSSDTLRNMLEYYGKRFSALRPTA
jgi:hypothetical protein